MSSFLGGGGGGSGGIIVNTTPIIGGTNGRFLADNAGMVGETPFITFTSGAHAMQFTSGDLNGNSIIILNSNPRMLFSDTEANGTDWVIGGGVVGTTPVFSLFAGASLLKTEWAVNLDGAGAETLRRDAVRGWVSDASNANVGSIDTGISRLLASVIAVGNGTAADHSGALNGGSAFFGSDTYANRNTAFGSLQVNSAGAKDGINIQQTGIVAWRIGLRPAADGDPQLYFNASSDTLQTTPAFSVSAAGVFTINGNTFEASVNGAANTLDLANPIFGAGTYTIAFGFNGSSGGFFLASNIGIFNASDIYFAGSPPNGGVIYEGSGAGTAGLYVGTANASHLFFYINRNGGGSITKAKITSLGSFVLQASGALATNATDGFTYIPTCAGTPTGTPTTQTGAVPIAYDTTNNKLYCYNSNWKADGNLQINTQTASYVLAISDQEGIVEMNAAGANAVTVPANATVAFPIGTRIMVVQVGAGQTTVQAAAGVTGDNFGALSAQWDAAWLYKRATDEWVMTLG